MGLTESRAAPRDFGPLGVTGTVVGLGWALLRFIPAALYQLKAAIPVMARPMIRVWISSVAS